MQTLDINKSKHYASVWQEFTPNIAWGTIVLFGAYLLGYYFTISSAMDGSLPYLAASFLCSCLAFAGFTVMHDAGHGSIIQMNSPFKPMEKIMGWLTSLPFLVVPYVFFQKIHDRHHAFTNDPDRDPDHYYFTDTWYGVVLNCLLLPIQYYILGVTKLRHIKAIRGTLLTTLIYQCTIFATLGGFTYLGYGTEVLYFALIPLPLTVFALAMTFDYIPHHPHKSLDRFHDTRIYPSKLLNLLMLGQNYHLLHHMYPRLPWYQYQSVYKEILPYLEENGAPIEDIVGGTRPGFMTSPNASNLLNSGKAVNLVLTVGSVDRLTDDAVAVTFKLPMGETLHYQAGQYITVSKWLNGEQQTRCYSLCTSPHTSGEKGELTVGVRHTPGGLVSGFINEALQAGDELIVKGPFGDFVYPPVRAKGQVANIDNLVLIAAGSGITPMLSILEAALHDSSASVIHLIYASGSIESMMFLPQIEALLTNYANRLKVTYVVEKNNLLSTDMQGRLDSKRLISLLPSSANTEFYVCGPEGLKNMVVETLASKDISVNRVHVEQFVATVTEPVGELHRVDIKLAQGHQHVLKVASNQTVLEVANAEGIKIPHACGNGTCGTCKFKVDEGVVGDIPDSIPGITSEETDAGFTLACQCKPMGSVIISEVRL